VVLEARRAGLAKARIFSRGRARSTTSVTTRRRGSTGTVRMALGNDSQLFGG
jgi:hypothetical protein